MMKLVSILFSARRTAFALVSGTVVLAGCGQKGALFIPSTPAAAQRASLPDTLRPGGAPPGSPTTPAASSPTPAR